MTDMKAKAAAEAARLEKKYGRNAGAVGSHTYPTDSIPTGILALDYALGTAGLARRHVIEVFGPPDIGKSSVIGLGTIANAQKMGLFCGIIALEPGFDPDWAFKRGVNPDELVIARPENGEEAFEILHEWCTDDLIDLILFDSIGAVVSKGEHEQDKMKSKVGGQSKLITDGIKRILIPTWKNNKCVILLNQVRDVIGSPIPNQVDSPGGHALKHSATVRVQLKQSGAPYKVKVDGEDVVAGRCLKAIIQRNKLREGTQQKAEFDFYQMETDEHPVGVDVGKDVVNTAIRTRVIEKAGAWYRHPSFPDGRIQSRDKTEEYILTNPKVQEQLRHEVLEVMAQKLAAEKTKKPDLEVIEGAG
jgi:recombination protein RecA